MEMDDRLTFTHLLISGIGVLREKVLPSLEQLTRKVVGL